MSARGDTKFAAVNASSSGNNAIVSAVSGKQIKVYSYVLVAAGAVTVKWRSANTDLTGPMPLAANGGVSSSGSRDSLNLLETVAGEALNLNLGGAVAVGGHITYGYE